MRRTQGRSAVFLLLTGLIGAAGCGEGATPVGTTPAPAEKTAPEAAAVADAPPTAAVADAPPAKKPAEPLTQEELDLIAADPATLTPSQRRDRAFALRKKIMQNPDSPAAQSLEKLRMQIESGEVRPQLPDRGITFHAKMPADKASTDPPADAPTKTPDAPAPAKTPDPQPAPGTR